MSPSHVGSDGQWDALVSWMEGKGMDVSPDSLPVQASSTPGNRKPGTQLCRIPHSSLINIFTLAPLYTFLPLEGCASPVRLTSKYALNATQLISLHLTLHRPRGDKDSTDPEFGPYISSLPRHFDDHPLTWLFKQRNAAVSQSENDLLGHIPPSVTSELNAVFVRFQEDWDVISLSMTTHSEWLLKQSRSDQLAAEDFLWAWLIVNTRCVYLRLFKSLSSASNLTLCPIIDFANHSTLSTLPMLVPAAAEQNEWMNGSVTLQIGRDFVFMTSDRHRINSGEELYLRYGGHPNRTLFTEYGFVDRFSDPSRGEVDVSDLVEECFKRRHDVGVWMQDALKAEGYKRAWSLHMFPPPAHPSWTLIVALRLLNLDVDASNLSNASDLESYLKPWRDSVLGLASIISEANEAEVRKELASICKVVLARSEAKLNFLRDCRTVADGNNLRMLRGLDDIMLLWKEEARVASAVLESLNDGLVL